MRRDVQGFVGLAAASVAVGLAVGCGPHRYAVHTDAPIQIRESGLGYSYYQAGTELSGDALLHILRANGGEVRS